MKRSVLVLILPILLFSCKKVTDKEPYSYERSTIYSDENSVNFHSILLDLKPYILDGSVKKYIVNPEITNVTLTLSGKAFGDAHSLTLDTAIVAKQVVNGYYVTTEDIIYPVNVPFRTNDVPLTNAGEFSDLLNNMVIVDPGFYHCKIASFEIKTSSGQTKKIPTNVAQFFEVKAGAKNYYLGSFEVLVK